MEARITISVASVRKARIACALMTALMSLGCAIHAAKPRGDQNRDVEQALADYRQAWLNGDRATVLEFLSPEVILFIPSRSKGRIVGKTAVRDFWFPESGVSYPVVGYEISDQEIFARGDFATVVGRSELTWETVEAGVVTDRSTSRSDFMTLLKKEDGQWRIYRQMYHIRD